MRLAKLLVVALMALVLAASASVALARQVALVVRNSTYAHIGRLPNPENDAVDLAAALRRIGFEVTTELDADRGELTEALRAFTRRSTGADVSLVFYAGHGLEMDGLNYPGAGRRTAGARRRRPLRDGDARRPAGVDGGGAAAAGDPGRLPEQPLARSMQRTVASLDLDVARPEF